MADNNGMSRSLQPACQLKQECIISGKKRRDICMCSSDGGIECPSTLAVFEGHSNSTLFSVVCSNNHSSTLIFFNPIMLVWEAGLSSPKPTREKSTWMMMWVWVGFWNTKLNRDMMWKVGFWVLFSLGPGGVSVRKKKWASPFAFFWLYSFGFNVMIPRKPFSVSSTWSWIGRGGCGVTVKKSYSEAFMLLKKKKWEMRDERNMNFHDES